MWKNAMTRNSQMNKFIANARIFKQQTGQRAKREWMNETIISINIEEHDFFFTLYFFLTCIIIKIFYTGSATNHHAYFQNWISVFGPNTQWQDCKINSSTEEVLYSQACVLKVGIFLILQYSNPFACWIYIILSTLKCMYKHLNQDHQLILWGP